MDTDPDAPADSTLDEQRPKGTPEHELASFGPDSPEAPEPEEPEDEKNATAEAERPVRVAESAAATPSKQTSREIGPDSAAAPVSPPASDRNATTSAQVKTLRSPTVPNRPRPKASIPTLFPESPNSRRKTISVRKEPRRSTPPPWLSARSPAPSDVQRHDPYPQPPQRRPIHGPQPRNPF